MLKVIHIEEIKKAYREKAKTVVEELHTMKLKEATKNIVGRVKETLTYRDFPFEHDRVKVCSQKVLLQYEIKLRSTALPR